MLLIVVSLEGNTNEDLVNVLDTPPSAWRQFKHARDLVQSEAFVVLKQGAADAPHITRVAPPQLCRRERRDTPFKLKSIRMTSLCCLVAKLDISYRV